MKKYCECGDHLYDHLKICPFCGKEKIGDSQLLDFVLEKYLNMSYDELVEAYIISNEDK